MTRKLVSSDFEELVNLIIEKLFSITHVYEKLQDKVRLEILQYSIMKLEAIIEIDSRPNCVAIENPNLVIMSCINDLIHSKTFISCHDTIRSINKIIFYLKKAVQN